LRAYNKTIWILSVTDFRQKFCSSSRRMIQYKLQILLRPKLVSL
jgi:hypothetical protein